MWLLDANMDVHLVDLLASFGLNSDTASNRGWNALSNGELVGMAVTHGFECLLTRDQLFAESAAKALRIHQRFAIVLVKLPQQRWPSYREQFLRAWSAAPIIPIAGASIEWPAKLP